MLSLLKTNQIIFNVFLLVYAIGLRSSWFITPIQPPSSTDGVLSILIKDLLKGNVLLEKVLVILLLFIQGILINNLATKHRLFHETTLLPGLFYILSMSILQDFFPFSAIVFGNLFLIISLDELLLTYKQPKCAGRIFNAGLWVGVASLFYSSFFLFFLSFYVGMSFLRNFKIKEYWILLSGFITPFLLIGTYFFWHDSLPQFWSQFTSQFSFLNFQYESTNIFFIKLGFIAFFFLLSFFNNYPFSKSNKIRSFLKVIYLLLFVSGLTFLFQSNITIVHFLIMMVPLSLLLTARFLAFNTGTAELLHTFLLIVILVFHYQGVELFS